MVMNQGNLSEFIQRSGRRLLAQLCGKPAQLLAQPPQFPPSNFAPCKSPHDRIRVDSQKNQRMLWNHFDPITRPCPKCKLEAETAQWTNSEIPEHSNVVIATDDQELLLRV